jgi:hypothetical protein
MTKHPEPADLQPAVDVIAERLIPFWGRAASVPVGIPIQAAISLGGRTPWYVEAAVVPPTDTSEWSGRVILIADDIFVVMTKEPAGENEAKTVAVTQPFAPTSVRLVGADAAWQDLPSTRPPGTAHVEFVFRDGSDLHVPIAVGSLRVQANDEALWARYFEIVDRLKPKRRSTS